MGFIYYSTWNILSRTCLIVKTCKKKQNCAIVHSFAASKSHRSASLFPAPYHPPMLNHLKNKPRGEETFLSTVLIQRFDRCVRFERKGPGDRAVLLVVTIEMRVTGDFCAACPHDSLFFPRDPGCFPPLDDLYNLAESRPHAYPHIIQTLSTLQPAPLSDLYRVGVALLDASFISCFIVLCQ